MPWCGSPIIHVLMQLISCLVIAVSFLAWCKGINADVYEMAGSQDGYYAASGVMLLFGLVSLIGGRPQSEAPSGEGAPPSPPPPSQKPGNEGCLYILSVSLLVFTLGYLCLLAPTITGRWMANQLDPRNSSRVLIQSSDFSIGLGRHPYGERQRRAEEQKKASDRRNQIIKDRQMQEQERKEMQRRLNESRAPWN